MTSRNLHLRISPELANDLQEICEQTGYSRAEVFWRAIALYKLAKEVEQNNGHVLLHSGSWDGIDPTVIELTHL